MQFPCICGFLQAFAARFDSFARQVSGEESDLERLELAEVRRIADKKRSGKSISQAEQTLLDAHHAKLEAGLTRVWCKTKKLLAEKLGISRNTLNERMKAPLFPASVSGKGWPLDECQDYMQRYQNGTLDQEEDKLPSGDASELKPGAQHALARLAEAEKQAAADYQAAYEGGNAQAIAIRLKTWTELLTKLHAFERIIDKDKREAGELIRRQEVEDWLATLGLGINYAEEAFLNQLGETISGLQDPRDPREVRQHVKSMLYECCAEMIETGVRERKHMPWMLEAFAKGFRP